MVLEFTAMNVNWSTELVNFKTSQSTIDQMLNEYKYVFQGVHWVLFSFLDHLNVKIAYSSYRIQNSCLNYCIS